MDDWDASSSDEQPKQQQQQPKDLPSGAPARKGKWDDEDEDDKVADDWDAPSEDEKPKPKPAPQVQQSQPKKSAPVAQPPKKKGTLKQKLTQKEEERKQRMEKSGEIDDGDAIDWLEQQRAEREAAKQQQLKSDMDNASDLLGGLGLSPSVANVLKSKPKSLSEFQSLAQTIQEVYFKPHQSNQLYNQYVTTLIKNLADTLKENEIRGLSTRMITIASEKSRAQKIAAKKNKQTKPSLGGGHTTSGAKLDTNIYDEALDYGDDDDLEFM